MSSSASVRRPPMRAIVGSKSFARVSSILAPLSGRIFAWRVPRVETGKPWAQLFCPFGFGAQTLYPSLILTRICGRLFRMILDIILDKINRRVILPLKQVNLTELRRDLVQILWSTASFTANPAGKFPAWRPRSLGLEFTAQVQCFPGRRAVKGPRLSVSRRKSNEQPDNFNRYGSRYRQLFL